MKKLIEIEDGMRVKITNVPKIVQKIPEVISEDEIKKIIEKVRDTRDKAIVALLYDCALKNGELRNLNMEDVNLEERTIFVRKRKRGLPQVIPFGEKTKEIIEEFLKERERRGFTQDALFPAYNERIDAHTIVNIIDRYSRLYLGKRITPLLLRHSRAIALRKKGISWDKIREFLGHSNSAGISIYTRMESEELKM